MRLSVPVDDICPEYDISRHAEQSKTDTNTHINTQHFVQVITLPCVLSLHVIILLQQFLHMCCGWGGGLNNHKCIILPLMVFLMVFFTRSNNTLLLKGEYRFHNRKSIAPCFPQRPSWQEDKWFTNYITTWDFVVIIQLTGPHVLLCPFLRYRSCYESVS